MRKQIKFYRGHEGLASENKTLKLAEELGNLNCVKLMPQKENAHFTQKIMGTNAETITDNIFAFIDSLSAAEKYKNLGLITKEIIK